MRNKVLCLLLALLMCGAALACNQSDGKKPDVTAEPTAEVQATEVTEPTEQPIDAAIISNYQGDWFGVFAITDCGGSFDGAKDMTNDCFVRFALQAAGTGESYILVNGNGDGLFAECMVKAAPDKLLLSGLIAGNDIAWEFLPSDDGFLTLEGKCGDDTDFFDVRIILRRVGDAWSVGDVYPANYVYALSYGYAALFENMGGLYLNMPLIPQIDGVEPVVIDGLE